jgi:hypothetical protein
MSWKSRNREPLHKTSSISLHNTSRAIIHKTSIINLHKTSIVKVHQISVINNHTPPHSLVHGQLISLLLSLRPKPHHRLAHKPPNLNAHRFRRNSDNFNSQARIDR